MTTCFASVSYYRVLAINIHGRHMEILTKLFGAAKFCQSRLEWSLMIIYRICLWKTLTFFNYVSCAKKCLAEVFSIVKSIENVKQIS